MEEALRYVGGLFAKLLSYKRADPFLITLVFIRPISRRLRSSDLVRSCLLPQPIGSGLLSSCHG